MMEKETMNLREKRKGAYGRARVKKESNYILISKIEINLKIFKE